MIQILFSYRSRKKIIMFFQMLEIAANVQTHGNLFRVLIIIFDEKKQLQLYLSKHSVDELHKIKTYKFEYYL